MAVLYRALDRQRGVPVALKVARLGDELDASGFLGERFGIEAAALRRLQHPAVPQLLDAGQAGGDRYLVMSWCPGRELGVVLREEPPPPWRVVRWMLQLARVLQHCHQRGVVHRDLKVANVLVDAEDQLHLVDFGLARLVDAEESRPPDSRLLGSVHSIPPEQLQSFTVDHRADVYSFGVIFYRALTGRYPFLGRQKVDVLVACLQGGAPPLAQVRPDLNLPPPLVRLVEACLERDPAARPDSMAAVEQQLLDVLPQLPSPPRLPAAALAALGALALGLVGWLLLA